MIINWLGMIMGIGMVLLGQLLEGGEMSALLQPTAALIVFGGTLGATLLSSTMKEFSEAVRGVPRIFFSKPPDFNALIKQIGSLAAAARKDGILALEKMVADIKNPFLSNNLRHLVDGYDPNVLREMMEERMGKEEEEKTAVAKVFETAGGFSPTVGIIGAVLGLIHVMSNLSDSSKLGGGIAVAFVATVYGVGSANLVFLPLANKLKKMAHDEMLEYELIYTGVMGIQAGLNPRVIEDRLANLVGGHGGGGDGKAGHGAEKKAA